MNWTSWILSLAGAIILMSIIPMLLSDETIKKYAIFACRIALLCILIKPISQLFTDMPQIGESIWNAPAGMSVTLQTEQSLRKKTELDILIWLNGEAGFEKASVSVELASSLQVAHITVCKNTEGGNNADNLKVKGLLCGLYQLDPQDVLIQ